MKNRAKQLLINVQAIIFVLFCFFICCCFWASGDDPAFARWMENGISFSNMITVFGVNGRYLGNTFGIVFSYLSMSDYWWIRAIFNALCIVALTVLIAKAASYKNYGQLQFAFFLSSIGIVTANIYCWLEFYAYSAGFMNYFLPTLIFLGVLTFVYKNNFSLSPRQTALMCFLVFVNCFFIEHITVYICLCSIALLIYTIVSYKTKEFSIPLLISALFGAFCMFAYPLICYDPNCTYRNTIFTSGWTLIVDNILQNSSFILFDHLFLTYAFLFIACYLLLYHFREYSLKQKNISVFFFLIFAASGACAFLRYFGSWHDTILSVFIAPATCSILTIFDLIALGFLLQWHLPASKKPLPLFLYISIWILCGILSCVSPLGPRCFFTVYTFLLIIIISLWLEGFPLLCSTIKGMAVLMIFLYFIGYASFVGNSYIIGHNVQLERQQYLEKAIQENASTVYVADSVNFTDCGGLRFLDDYYYYTSPGDLEIIFIPYDEWHESIQ